MFALVLVKRSFWPFFYFQNKEQVTPRIMILELGLVRDLIIMFDYDVGKLAVLISNKVLFL